MSRLAAGWHRAFDAPATAIGATSVRSECATAAVTRHAPPDTTAAARSDRIGPLRSVTRPRGAEVKAAAAKNAAKAMPTPLASKSRSRPTWTAIAPTRNDGSTQAVVTAAVEARTRNGPAPRTVGFSSRRAARLGRRLRRARND